MATLADQYMVFADVPLVWRHQTAHYARHIAAIDRPCQELINDTTFHGRAWRHPTVANAHLRLSQADTPAVDGAWWYDVNKPQSNDFHGLLVHSVLGLEGSTFGRTTTRLAQGGSAFAEGIYGPRQITVQGVLFAATCCGAAYGLKALSDILINPNCETDLDCVDGVGCEGYELSFPRCVDAPNCEGVTNEQPALDQFGYLKDVRLVRPPTVLTQVGDSCGCGGCPLMEVEFVLEAGNGHIWSLEYQVATTAALDPAVLTAETVTFDDTCQPGGICAGDDVCNIDPESSTLAIPAAPGADSLAHPISFYRTALAVSTTATAGHLGTTALGLSIRTPVAGPIRNLRLDFVPNDGTFDCADPLDMHWTHTQCLSCHTIIIGYAPADSFITLDPTMREASLVCDGKKFPLDVRRLDWVETTCTDYCVIATIAEDDLPGQMQNITVTAADRL